MRWLILCRYYSRVTRGVAEGMYVGASVESRVLNTMRTTTSCGTTPAHTIDHAFSTFTIGARLMLIAALLDKVAG